MLHTRICPLYRSTEGVTCTYRSHPVILLVINMKGYKMKSPILKRQGRRWRHGRYDHGRTIFWAKKVLVGPHFQPKSSHFFSRLCFNMMTKAWLLIDNWSKHRSILHLPQSVKGGCYKNKIKELTTDTYNSNYN